MKYIKPSWPSPSNVRALTTLRSSWGNGEYLNHIPYAQFISNDSKQLESLLHLPSEPIWLNQTHTSIVVPAIPENRTCVADASFTNVANHICVVVTADCLPILICNKSGTKVAAIHAGWRGLANDIIENTLDALSESASNLLVWLGPAIGPTKYEVGQDVFDIFIKKSAESAAGFVPYQSGKWLANLYDLAKIRLNLRGISQIYGGEYCTYTQSELFFSYRRDKGRTGRMASLIWISDD